MFSQADAWTDRLMDGRTDWCTVYPINNLAFLKHETPQNSSFPKKTSVERHWYVDEQNRSRDVLVLLLRSGARACIGKRSLLTMHARLCRCR